MGEYNFYSVTAKSSGALIKDKLFFSVGGVYDKRDGFIQNTFLHNRSDNQENFSGRGVLRWQPSNEWDVRLTLTKENFDYGAPRFTRLDNSVRYSSSADLAQRLQQNTASQSLRIAYQSKDYTLLSVSSRRFWQMSPFDVDLDLTSNPIASRHLNISDATWTQEFRLSPKATGV